MKPNNKNATKPESEKVWNKGRITVDLGVPLKTILDSYADRTGQTKKQVVLQALNEKLSNG